MEFTDYFKKLYTGKDIWRKHILLFSVVGIMTLLLNNVTTSYANGFLLTNNLMVAPHALETIVDFIFGLILWVHIFGYEYKFLSDIMNDREMALPEFDFEIIVTFCKMLPLFLLWQLYFAAIFVMTMSYTLASKNLLYYFLIGTLMLFITPFVFMIYIKFSKDFKYTPQITEPWHIIKYIDKGLIDVVLWSVKFGAFALIPTAFFVGYMDWAINLTQQLPRLIAYLAGLCAASYVFVVLKLIYGAGMAKIVKEKIIKDNE